MLMLKLAQDPNLNASLTTKTINRALIIRFVFSILMNNLLWAITWSNLLYNNVVSVN